MAPSRSVRSTRGAFVRFTAVLAVASVTLVGVEITAADATAESASWSSAKAAVGVPGIASGGDANGLAVGPDGKAVIAGWFDDSLNFPMSNGTTKSLTAPAGSGLFVAQWDPATTLFTQAQRSFGTSGEVNVWSVAMAGTDKALIIGNISTSFPPGSGPAVTQYFPTAADDSVALIVPASSKNAFIAAWKPSTGYFLWARSLPATAGAIDQGNSLAYSGSGTPYVSGQFQSTIYFPKPGDDSFALTSTSGSSGFVAALHSPDDSTFAWAQAIDSVSGGGVMADTIAVSGSNAPVVTGTVSSTIATFPTSRDDSIALDSPSQSVFVARMKNADDSYFGWATVIKGSGTASSGSIASTSTGVPVVAGDFDGTVYFPKHGDDSIAMTGSADSFVAQTVSADDSAFAWVLPIESTGSISAYVSTLSVAVGVDGSPVVSGWLTGSAAFPTGVGGGVITLAQDDTATSAFVAGVKADGSGFEWALKSGGSGGGNSADGVQLAITPASADPRFAGSPVISGFFAGQVTFGNSTLTSVGDAFGFFGQRNPFIATVALSSTPTPTPPAPVYPPSAPMEAKAVAGNAAATVSWSAPTSSGSYPISTYSVTSIPAGGSCMATAPALTCEVKGLTNGTTYTFKVKALNGAGWSEESAPSNAVTPKGVAPTEKTITITGSRDGGYIAVSGSSTGIDPGAILKPWIRFPGQTTPTEGTAKIEVDAKGNFSWERKSGKKTYVYVQTADGKVKSNTVTIAAR